MRAIVAGQHADKLAHTIDFGFHEGGRAGADVACRTFDPRMGRMLIGRELGFHRRMTRLAAKRHRLGVMVGPVAADGSQQQKNHAAGDKAGEHSFVARPRSGVQLE